ARLPAGPTTTAGILRDRAAAVSADRRERRAPLACARGGGGRRGRAHICALGGRRAAGGERGPGPRGGGAGWGAGWLQLGLVGGSAANTTRGIRPRAATVSAVMIWVKPGPQVTEATPTLPVAR